MTADLGYFCIVTATNAHGSASEQSNDLLTANVPNNTILPAINDDTEVGSLLSCTTGTWLNSPTSYTYQWKRAPDTLIVDATSSTYTLVTADAGHSILCTVTATNAAGVRAANSNTIGSITIVPFNTVAPVVSGTTEVGFSLTTTDGTWDGVPTPTFSYQWKRGSTSITDATDNIYVLTNDDIGFMIKCTVTATNIAGAVPQDSNAVGPITAGSGWTPAALGSALKAWYKADAGVYVDAGVTPATDGQTVRQWNDQSGNGYHMVQATAGNRPTYDTTGFNGLPALVLSGAAQRMDTGEVVMRGSGGSMSIFVVCQMGSSTTYYGRLIVYLGTGETGDYSDSHSCIAIGRQSTDNTILVYRILGVKSTALIDVDTNYRLGSIFDGADNTLYVNNDAATPVASGGTFNSPGTIGISYANEWAGPIAEIIVTNTALTPTERNQLDDYFTEKWGL